MKSLSWIGWLPLLCVPGVTLPAPVGQGALGDAEITADVEALPAIDHADTLRVVRERFEGGEWNAALAEVTGLIEVSTSYPEWQQAEAQYARGLALLYRALEAGPQSLLPAVGLPESSRAADWFDAASAFGSARALAGPGTLRRHATYDMGVAHLMRAETWFGEIPEVAEQRGTTPVLGGAGGQGMPGMGAVPGLPGSASPTTKSKEEKPPDPLAEARSAFLAAKEHLIQRLREDWRDEDTRANLEWIQRRLRELDEIEKQREEQQDQEQEQDQQSDEDQESEEDPDAEPEEGEDPADQDSEPSDEEQKPSDDESQQDQQQDQKGEQDEASEDEAEEAQRPEEGEGEAHGSDEPPAERLLTREEVMRLLDKLSELEEEREALEAQMQRARQIPVERDW